MKRRLHLARGRVLVYLDVRDWWIGVYIAEDYVYVCPLPLLVVRIDRDWRALDRWAANRG